MINRSIIELKNVSKKSDDHGLITDILENICLSVQRSDYVSICGPSGAGKTSLLSILGLIDREYVGRYKFKGLDIQQLNNNQLSELRNKEIGFVFQSLNLINDLTVFENIALPVRYSLKNWSNVKNNVLTALKTVDMRHSYSYYPNELSTGQQRLLSIARAIVMSPSMLIVDEPTKNLDSSSSALVMNTIKKINKKGVTVFTATHNARDAEHADTKINLCDGKIISSTEYERLYR